MRGSLCLRQTRNSLTLSFHMVSGQCCQFFEIFMNANRLYRIFFHPPSSNISGFEMRLITSKRNPFTPLFFQKRTTFFNSSRTLGFSQFKSAWLTSNRCRYHFFREETYSHADPPNLDSQFVGRENYGRKKKQYHIPDAASERV